MKRPRPARQSPGPRRGGGTVRIIGGQWRRRVLPVIDVEGLRPTPDRVRVTLFNWLMNALGDLAGLAVLDLFAGTGALGIESASRGAAPVILVERNAAAVDSLRSTCALLGATQIEIRAGDAMQVGGALRDAGRQFALVLLDPPFAKGWIESALPLATTLCSPGGFIYVEAEGPLDEHLLSETDVAMHRADKAGEVFYHLLRRNKKE